MRKTTKTPSTPAAIQMVGGEPIPFPTPPTDMPTLSARNAHRYNAARMDRFMVIAAWHAAGFLPRPSKAVVGGRPLLAGTVRWRGSRKQALATVAESRVVHALAETVAGFGTSPTLFALRLWHQTVSITATLTKPAALHGRVTRPLAQATAMEFPPASVKTTCPPSSTRKSPAP